MVHDVPRGDLRRLWLTLGALAARGGKATLLELVADTGMPKPTVSDMLVKLVAGQVVDVAVEKEGALYRVHDWGRVVSPSGIQQWLKDYQQKI
ncbi:MAG: helix-turn-helix domain-containing protein [Gammaproteobacteria bacterium]|nr:helix-turn-helix domain-containing protein [Gammaproteobacteria bacterium]